MCHHNYDHNTNKLDHFKGQSFFPEFYETLSDYGHTIECNLVIIHATDNQCCSAMVCSSSRLAPGDCQPRPDGEGLGLEDQDSQAQRGPEEAGQRNRLVPVCTGLNWF